MTVKKIKHSGTATPRPRNKARTPTPQDGLVVDFRIFFEHATDGILLADTKTRRFLLANRKIQQMLGYSEKELLTMSVKDIHPAADLPKVFKNFDKRIHLNRTWDNELRVLRKNGTVFFAEISGAVIHIKKREYLVGVFRDVTERVREREKLLLNNLLLSTQQEVSIDGILVVDEHDRILSYNNRFVDMWKLSAALVASRADKPVLQFVAKQVTGQKSFLAKVHHLYRHRKETSQDELLLKDGRVFERYSAPMVGPTGHYYGRVWYFRNVSRRKHAEEKFSRAFQSSPVLTAISTISEGRYIDVNEAFLKTLGFSRKAVINRTSIELGIFAEPQFRQKIVDKVSKQGFARNVEIKIFDKDRNVRWGLFSADRIFVGDEPCWLTTMLDITDRKVATEALRTKNIELDRSVAQLRKLAMELTQSEDRERKRLATRIHDDVQQFLVAATMKISLLDKNEPSQNHDRAVHESLKLLDNALKASRALTTDLYPPVLMEGGVLHGLRWLADQMHTTHGLTVTVSGKVLPNLPPPLSTMLFQGVRELLFNVVKHAGVATAAVDVSQSKFGTIQITVSDEGCGYPVDPIASTTATPGLGLFHLRERLTYFGGSITIRGTPGKGTCVIIEIPFK